ncbi:MAG: hypothetical protein SFH39_02655 [Candidatus Magnetobacterium sp. LHC-1]|nr:hypothetical protein [Nitrospirota bacterium]
MKNIAVAILVVAFLGLVKPPSLNIDIQNERNLHTILDVCSDNDAGGVFDNHADSFCEKIVSVEILEYVASYFPPEKHRYKFIEFSISDKPPRQNNFLV